MELPLSHFFAEPGNSNGSKSLPQLSDDELRFLTQIRRYPSSLNDSDRKLVVAMVRRMASKYPRAVKDYKLSTFVHSLPYPSGTSPIAHTAITLADGVGG